MLLLLLRFIYRDKSTSYYAKEDTKMILDIIQIILALIAFVGLVAIAKAAKDTEDDYNKRIESIFNSSCVVYNNKLYQVREINVEEELD